jgi:hypothetical protein
MNLKNAALLALCGAILLTLYLIVSLIRNIFGVAEGILPAMSLLSSLIFTFAGLTAALFLYAFHRTQS